MCPEAQSATEPSADQTHIVIKREPADEGVFPVEPDRLTHRSDVCQQLTVGEHHALGVPGAPRGVLEQSRVVSVGDECCGECAIGRGVKQLLGGCGAFEGGHVAAQDAGDEFSL